MYKGCSYRQGIVGEAMASQQSLRRSENSEMAHERNLMENLLNAIIERAVLDYERALCTSDMDTIREIERIAERGEIDFTDYHLEDILCDVRKKWKEFRNLALGREREIREMTEEFKKSVRYRPDFTNFPIKCPLCHGGVYFHKTKYGNRIKCTSCGLFVEVERKIDGKLVRVV